MSLITNETSRLVSENEVKSSTPDATPLTGSNVQTCPFSSRQAFANWLAALATRFFKFGFVGASGMIIDLGAYSLLMHALPMQGARALAIVVAMTWNFFWNRQVTFSDARHRSWFRQYLGYCAGCLMGAIVNWWVSLSVGAWHPWLKTHPLLAAVIGVIAGMIFNFSFCLLWVFRPRQSTKPHHRIEM